MQSHFCEWYKGDKVALTDFTCEAGNANSQHWPTESCTCFMHNKTIDNAHFLGEISLSQMWLHLNAFCLSPVLTAVPGCHATRGCRCFVSVWVQENRIEIQKHNFHGLLSAELRVIQSELRNINSQFWLYFIELRVSLTTILTHNCEFISCSSEQKSHNCEIQSHNNASEIIPFCWFSAQIIFPIINVENSCLA